MQKNQHQLSMPLRGIIPPMVTPLSDKDSLDTEGLNRLYEHVIGGGVHGVFVLGTTGEAPSLSHRLRHELVARVCDIVHGRVPVLVGISDTCFAESVNLAHKAAEAGADAVVLAAPYYFPAGQEELLEYLSHLTAEVRLPLLLYNMPYAPPAFAVETVRKAADMDGIIGIKDSSADLEYFKNLLAALKDRLDFTVLNGPEAMLAETLLLGAHGGVPGAANLVPRLYVELYEAAVSGDRERLETLHSRAMQINEKIYRVGRYRSSFLKGLKCALACLGICSDFLAEPFHSFRDQERAVIKANLEELGIERN